MRSNASTATAPSTGIFLDAPGNWQVKKLGFLASFRSGESITSDSIKDSGSFPVYGGNGLRGYTEAFTHRGDHVLIGRQGALCGNVNYASGEFWASEHAIVVSPREEVAVRWLGEALRAMNLNQYSLSAAQPGIAVEAISALKIGIPPLREQRSIADYLTRETAQIDALADEKERMLALLEEKRAAQVTHAVCRGLNPDAQLKPSGLEWLGDIPKHWEIIKLKQFTAIGNGATPSVENHEYWADAESGFPWLNSSVVNDEDVREASRYVTEIALSQCHLPKIIPPALLVGITGQGRTRGKSSVLFFDATINQHLAYVKPSKERGDCHFLRLMLGAAYSFLRSDSDGAGSKKGAITCEQLENFAVPLPPLAEQRAIVAHLAAEKARTAELEKTLRDSITLLHERRRALITAAVTGQIAPEAMSA